MASPRPYKLSERGIRPSEVNRKYLHTNSTSHTWPFSAFAELIDNAYDPDVGAKQIWIDKTVIIGEQCLMFRDNGKGMCPDKLHKMLSFGFCEKQKVDNHVPIGMYGNGFKSGSMRLGRDALVFTKNGTQMSVGMLSQSYLEAINQETIIVPIAVWSQKDHKLEPVEDREVSLRDILHYSLFRTEQQLLTELSAIQTRTGTKIIIWNLRQNRAKSLELDFETDKYDILIPHDLVEEQLGLNNRQSYGERQRQMPDSEYSLRAYCSILYLKPRTQVILRGAKVKTQLIAKSLAHIDHDIYQPMFLTSMKRKVKVTFGFNCKSKVHYGIMMYHHNRLIKAYERMKCQLQVNGVGEGVIGIIECDFLKPTHNKQDFDQTNEYRLTLSAVDRKLQEYWRDRSNLSSFLVDSTFNSKDLIEKPDQIWAQCDSCLKWRKLPDDIGKLPDKWYCRLNPDPQFRTCDVPEEAEDTDEMDVYKKSVRRRELREKAEQQQNARLQKEAMQRKVQLAAQAKQSNQVVPPLVIHTVTDGNGVTSAAVLRTGKPPTLVGAAAPVAGAASPSVPTARRIPGGAEAAGPEMVQNLMNRVIQEAAFLKREKENLKQLSRQTIQAETTAVAEISRITAQHKMASCSSTASPSTSSSSSACEGLRISDVKSLSADGAWRQPSPCANGTGSSPGGVANREKRKLEACGMDQAKRPRMEPAESSPAANGVASSRAGAASSITFDDGDDDDDDVICLDVKSPRVPQIDADLRKVKLEADASTGPDNEAAQARDAAATSSHGVQTVTLPFKCKAEEEDSGDAGDSAAGAAGAVPRASSAVDAAVDVLRRENKRLQEVVQQLQQELVTRTVVKEEDKKQTEEKAELVAIVPAGSAKVDKAVGDSEAAPDEVHALRRELQKLRKDEEEWASVISHLMKEIEDSVAGHKQTTAENERLSEECARLRAAAPGQTPVKTEAGTNTDCATDVAGAAADAGVDACVGPDADTASETTEEGRKLQAELEKTGAELEQLQREKVELEARETETAIYLSQGMSDGDSLVRLRQNVARLLQNLIPEFQMPDDPTLVDDIVPQLLKSTSS
ncbi:MORC family CW-type zinc finger protein 3 [Lampetra fluviatilis]